MGNCLRSKKVPEQPQTVVGVNNTDADAPLVVEEGVIEIWSREQEALKARLIIEDVSECAKSYTPTTPHFLGLNYVGGVDISFVKNDNVNACAALIIVSFPDQKVVYEDCTMVKLTAPYIPGFLAFREASFLVEAMERLKAAKPEFLPQVVLVDGNGILHPRGVGLACHLGVLLDLSTVGVAKKLFQVDGLEKNEAHLNKIQSLQKRGDAFPLVGESRRTLGMAVRTCDSSTNPVYVSPGHKISVDTAVALVVECSLYRIPEPVRQADIKSREYLRLNFKN